MTEHTPALQMHHSVDVTGYPCFFVHGLSGAQKYDQKLLDTYMAMFAAAPALLAACEAAKNVITYWDLTKTEDIVATLEQVVAAIQLARGA